MDSKSHRKLTFCCYHSLIWWGSSNMPLLMNQTRSISVSLLVQNRHNYLIVCAAQALSTPAQAALHQSCPRSEHRDAPAATSIRCSASHTLWKLLPTSWSLSIGHLLHILEQVTSFAEIRGLCYCPFPKRSLNSHTSPKCTHMSNIRNWNLNLLA